MAKEFDVHVGSERIGAVRVWEDGLYLRFSCRCAISGDVMFSLKLRGRAGEVDLGLLAPMDGSFGLEKRISRKQVGEEPWCFFLRPRHKALDQRFIPIRAEEPFAYLHRLEQCFMAVRDGEAGIFLPNEK